MSTPLVATWRMTAPYQSQARQHTAHCYVRGAQLQGADYYINSRTADANDTLWTNAADRFCNALAFELPTGASFGTVLLQHIESGVWITKATHTPSITAASGTAVPASQITMTLRTNQNHHLRVVVEDTEEAAPQRTENPNGGGASMDSFTGAFLSIAGNGNDPFNWIVGRDNAYLAAAPFVSISADINRKVKRAAGY